MVVKKNIKLILLLVLFPIKFLSSQPDSNIAILDFNNVKQVLNVKEIWSEEACILSLKGSEGDILKVSGVSEIINKQVLADKFLKIEFRIRGGTGIHLRITKLFSVKKNRIYQVLSLLTQYQYQSLGGNENENYGVKFSLLHNRALKIILTESGENLEGIKQKWSKQFTLSFDSLNMVFYNKIKYSTQVKTCDSIQKKSNIYAVELKNEKYFSLSNRWFQLVENCYQPF